MKSVSVKFLVLQGACKVQLKIFKKTFGERAKITLSNIKKAQVARLSYSWAASVLLTSKQQNAADRASIKMWNRYWNNGDGVLTATGEIAWASFAIGAGLAKLKHKGIGFDALKEV